MPQRSAKKRRLGDPALDSRREDGFYAHVLASLPRELLRTPSRAGNGELLVVEHGPWRVLWMQRSGTGTKSCDAASADFFQGVTFHQAGELVPCVIGFDYQRSMVAAALPFLLGSVRTPRPVACLVGLGAGSCAAALAALAAGRFSVSAVEIDEAVVHAATAVHGVRTAPAVGASALETTRGGRSSRGASGAASCARPVLVSVADAGDHFRSATPDSLGAVLLDAYDRRGRVPAKLQGANFIAAVARALAPGGVVLANVWRIEDAERRASDAFARRLRSAVGEVFSLRVHPHREGNLLLLAIKAGGGAEAAGAGRGARAPEPLRRMLSQAAAEHGAELEPELLACMRSNAASLRVWDEAD